MQSDDNLVIVIRIVLFIPFTKALVTHFFRE